MSGAAFREVRAWRAASHPVRLYRAVQSLFGWAPRLLFRTGREGIAKIPRTGPVILATNHSSLIDPILVAASLNRPVYNLSKHTLFQNRFMSAFLETLAGQIPVNRDSGGNTGALEAGLIVLERGLALGIYPEGTRSPDGSLRAGSTGVALFAFLTGAPIYPVAVKGTYEVWPRHRRVPKLFRPTGVIVGDPIRVPRDPAAADDARKCRQLTDQVMTALAALLEIPYHRPRAGPRSKYGAA